MRVLAFWTPGKVQTTYKPETKKGGRKAIEKEIQCNRGLRNKDWLGRHHSKSLRWNPVALRFSFYITFFQFTHRLSPLNTKPLICAFYPLPGPCFNSWVPPKTVQLSPPVSLPCDQRPPYGPFGDHQRALSKHRSDQGSQAFSCSSYLLTVKTPGSDRSAILPTFLNSFIFPSTNLYLKKIAFYTWN